VVWPRLEWGQSTEGRKRDNISSVDQSTPIVCRPMSSPSRPSPQSLRELFVFFSLLALQGFGGIIAFIERGLVQQKKWMTREEFLDDWAVARTMPGPPAINMGIIVGARYFGAKGATVAVLGMFFVPTIIVLLLALLYSRFGDQPQVLGALRGMGAVAAGMIIATGLKLTTALRTNTMGVRVCALVGATSFLAVSVFQVRVVYVLAMLGFVACSYAFFRLKDRSGR
jgi:chromate transporter